MIRHQLKLITIAAEKFRFNCIGILIYYITLPGNVVSMPNISLASQSHMKCWGCQLLFHVFKIASASCMQTLVSFPTIKEPTMVKPTLVFTHKKYKGKSYTVVLYVPSKRTISCPYLCNNSFCQAVWWMNRKLWGLSHSS